MTTAPTQSAHLSTRLLVLGLILLNLSACGFALRGSESITSQYDSLSLDVDQPNGELTRLLRRSLEVADVAVLDTGSNVPVLSVRNERSVSRPVSINPRARAAQYEIRLSVDVSLIQDEQELLAPETLLVERTYFEDIANIAGNQDEVAIITAEMRRDLVNQVLRRLEAGSAR